MLYDKDVLWHVVYMYIRSFFLFLVDDTLALYLYRESSTM
jgi:hypothetical protein